MKRKSFNVIFSFFIFCSIGSAQQPDSVRFYLDSALNIMQNHSMFSKNIDWKTVRDSAHLLARDATTYEGTYDALKYAFNKLGDKHGWLSLNDTDYRNPAFKTDTGRISEDMKAAAMNGAKIYCGVVENEYAYLSMPFFGGQTTDKMNSFAQRLQDSLCKVLKPSSKGLILDLRLNAGGNLFPMLVGVSNVIGNGKYGYTSTEDESAYIKDYGITLKTTDSVYHIQLQYNCGDYSNLPVAVIIGPVTGSAGEGVAITFAARPNTVLIGERSAGFTSSNNGYLLPGGRDGIVIGEGFDKDKNGKEYIDDVKPEIEVVGGDAFFDRKKDKKIQAALKWLKNKNR